MRTEELEDILRLDFQLPEGEGLDTDTILYITELIACRESASSKISRRNVEGAWQDLLTQYLPDGTNDVWGTGGEPEPDDAFYMEDLIGFSVDADGRRGVVTEYYDSDANPLFGITFDGREYLVPAVGEFVTKIDFDGRRMTMSLPEGLLALDD